MPEAQDAPAACLLEMCLNHHPLSVPLTDRAPGTRRVGAPARGCPCRLSKATCAHVTPPPPTPHAWQDPGLPGGWEASAKARRQCSMPALGLQGASPAEQPVGPGARALGHSQDHHPPPSEEPSQSGPAVRGSALGQRTAPGRSALGPGVCRAESPRFARGAEAEAASHLPAVRGWGLGLSTQGEEGGKQARDLPAPQH